MSGRAVGWSGVFLLGVIGLIVAIVTKGGLFLPALVVLFSGAALADRRVADRITN